MRISDWSSDVCSSDLRIDEQQRVSQPAPFSKGQTALEQNSSVAVDEEMRPMFLLDPGPQLADIVKAVNAIGASPADLVAILEAPKEAGALKDRKRTRLNSSD